MISYQKVIFITTPLLIHKFANSRLQIIVYWSTKIEFLKHYEELLEFFFVLKFAVEKLDVANHIRELVQNKWEARDSSKQHHRPQKSFIIVFWVEVAKTYSWQACQCKIHGRNCFGVLLIFTFIPLLAFSELFYVTVVAKREYLHENDPVLSHKIGNENNI